MTHLGKCAVKLLICAELWLLRQLSAYREKQLYIVNRYVGGDVASADSPYRD